jgi:hypothetical protein
MTTLVEHGVFPVAQRESVPAIRRIAGEVLLLAGVALLCAAAIALRFAVAPHVVIEPARALAGFSALAVLGVLTIAAAVHARGES